MKVEIVALGHDFLRVLIIIIAVSILIENIPCIHKHFIFILSFNFAGILSFIFQCSL